ncbi:hypothetical protein MLD38_028400 [Melastoma candidum]|uniref:Uncharacterized protein n=1 Tax=Melastoma candidum TaxID=119954 RepID=A0ACB9N289_9MYRT|nr:hypothetical protein MLD38_028400 [Melastoma candidum]
MNLAAEEVLSRSFALQRLYLLLQRSVLRSKSPDPDLLDEEAQMLLKDLLVFALMGIVEALRKVIVAKEHGQDPSPAQRENAIVGSAVPPDFSGNFSSIRDFGTRVEKDGLHRRDTPSWQLASGQFSIGTSSGELGPRKRICRVCSRQKQAILDTDPSLPAERLYGQVVSDTQKVDFATDPSLPAEGLYGQVSDVRKVDFVRAHTRGSQGLGNHADRDKYRETGRSPSGILFDQISSRKRPAGASFTAAAIPLDKRSEVVKEVSQRISEIEAGILALQLSSSDAKPIENRYRRRNGISGVNSTISSRTGDEEWKRPVHSGHFSVKDVSCRERIPARLESTVDVMVNPESSSQSSSQDAKMRSSGPDLVVHGVRVPSSHAYGYKHSRSRLRRLLKSKESLSAAVKTPKSRYRILPDSVSQVNENKDESNLSYSRYKSFKTISTQSRGNLNSRTSRIYESGLEDQGSRKGRRSREMMAIRQEKNKRLSPLESENSGSEWSSRYLPSSQESGMLSESSSSSSPSREYSADSESSTRLSDKCSSYTYSVPSHRGHVNLQRIPERRREFEMHVQANHEKAVGRLRRLKNKLGLIFHHHHHHHHHHHDPGQDAIRKPLQDAFCRKDEVEIVKRSRNGNGLARNRNDQVGHFRMLLHGLRSHLRRSKKPKGNILRNKRAKKSHWWKTMRQRHRSGTTLPSRGRGKLKLGARRPLIKVPKLLR